MSEFLTLYPGQYLPEERAAMERIRTRIREDLKRRDMSFEELVATAGGQSRGVPYQVTVENAENE